MTSSDAVQFTGVSKTFVGIRALDDVSFAVSRGEIHALLGENGAGKSTLLKILSGVQGPDSGSVTIAGEPIVDFSPEVARRAGVAMIFQEMSLVPTLTVAQNIFLTREIQGRLGLIDDRQAERRAAALFETFGVDVDPRSAVADLAAGQRQLTEIVKAISQTARILILDEPTSALSAAEVDKLFAFLRRIRSEGVAVIYVSHRMDEIMRIADRATILRDGRHIVTAPVAELTLEKIVEYMVGRRAGFSGLHSEDSSLGPVHLELRAVSGERKPTGVDLTARRGEVVGIAGLLGSGRSSLARVLCGIDPLVAGEIRIGGEPVRIANPQAAVAAGIALVPEDRIRQGVVAQHSVADNISLPALDQMSYAHWIKRHAVNALVDGQIERLRIKTSSGDTIVRTLSGGNQQKVVVAKWLGVDPQILVLDEPTAGIDIGSKTEIVALIRELAAQGKTILLISSELPELLAASDSIVVMADGTTVAKFSRNDIFPPAAATRDPVEALNAAERKLQVVLQGGLRNG